METSKSDPPNVKAGSIIEISYSFNSDFIFNLQDWTFQKQIPSLESSYSVEIPEYFNYKQFPHGYIHYSTDIKSSSTSITVSGDQVSLDCNKYDYHCENIPAFPSTEYLYAVENYISSVEYELATSQNTRDFI